LLLCFSDVFDARYRIVWLMLTMWIPNGISTADYLGLRFSRMQKPRNLFRNQFWHVKVVTGVGPSDRESAVIPRARKVGGFGSISRSVANMMESVAPAAAAIQDQVADQAISD
jgi:hypothetical protein